MFSINVKDSSPEFAYNLSKTITEIYISEYAALFLACDEAKFITGVALPVDGGRTCRVG